MDTEKERQARAFRAEHGLSGNQQKGASDHPLVEVERLRHDSALLFADDTNQAFSQIRMGSKLNEMFAMQDETKDFALAYSFATHPLDDVEAELTEMGITTKIKVREIKIIDGNEQEVIIEKEVPISFEVTQLKIFIDEWMRKRVPANRGRVKEFIDLITGLKSNDILTQRPIQNPQEPLTRGRIM